MSISNIEQGYGAIDSDAEAKPTKSSWRRTLVALAAASVVVVGATAAYSARTAKASKNTSLEVQYRDGDEVPNWIKGGEHVIKSGIAAAADGEDFIEQATEVVLGIEHMLPPAKGTTGSWQESAYPLLAPEWQDKNDGKWHVKALLRKGSGDWKYNLDPKNYDWSETMILPGQTYSNDEGRFKLDE